MADDKNREPKHDESFFRVKAWLEKNQRDQLHPDGQTDEPLPIEIVEATVAKIEKKVKSQRENKPKPFNILHQPDDNYDFAIAKNGIPVPDIKDEPRRRMKPKPVKKEESVLDAFEDQRRMFELDDYIHAEDSNPGPMVYKSQPLKISNAISRFQPPALGPFPSKPIVEIPVPSKGLRPILKGQNGAYSSRKLVNKHEAKFLYHGKMGDQEEVVASRPESFNPTVLLPKLPAKAVKKDDKLKPLKRPNPLKPLDSNGSKGSKGKGSKFHVNP